MAFPTKERIEEFRALEAADRQARRDDFKRDWPMHLLVVLRHSGLGIVFGLALEIWLFKHLVGF